MTLGWLDALALFTLIQLLFLAIVALRYNKGRSLSNRLLSAFLLANALLLVQFLLTRVGYSTGKQILILLGSGNSMYLLLMPLLYLYVESLSYRDFSLLPVHLLHAVPAAMLSVLFWVVTGAGDRGITWLHVTQAAGLRMYFVLGKGFVHAQIVAYLIATGYLLRRYRTGLKQVYSSLQNLDLSWCNLLLAGFASMWFVDVIGWVLTLLALNQEPLRSILITLSLLVNLVLAMALSYKGLLQAGSFSGILTPPRYASSPLPPEESAEIIRKLDDLMKRENPCLDSSLTVENLSQKLGVSARNLSQAIHTRLNMNFYDLVNAHRIEAAKEKLKSDETRAQTLLALAYDVGFNSKSVFNTAFKKHTGVTPKVFREQLLKSQESVISGPHA